jgi:hypothetical protein
MSQSLTELEALPMIICAPSFRYQCDANSRPLTIGQLSFDLSAAFFLDRITRSFLVGPSPTGPSSHSPRADLNARTVVRQMCTPSPYPAGIMLMSKVSSLWQTSASGHQTLPQDALVRCHAMTSHLVVVTHF